MQNQAERTEAIRKLAELIKNIKFAMLTTVEPDGTLRSRPMATQQVEFDGDLWFFTGIDSHKAYQIQWDPYHVNVTFADPNNHTYISMSGEAHVVRDQEKTRELWNDLYKAYFPQGLEDPNLALIKVSVEQAEYWDSPSSGITRVYRLAKSLVSGKPYQEQARQSGENQKLSLK